MSSRLRRLERPNAVLESVRGGACLALLVVVGLTQSALAQDAGAPRSGVSGGPEGAAERTAPTSIYIPYKKLKAVFEREGRGVFLPYEQFRALWDAAHDGSPPPPKPTAPVDAIINETSNEATVAADVVHVRSLVRVEMLGKGWVEVPLELADTAITKATIAGESARIVNAGGGGYALLYEKRTEEPESVDLELEYVKAYATTPGKNSVSFNAPRAPISRWRVTIPEPGIRVNMFPLIAATEAPDEAEAGQTVILAFVGAAPVVGIDWTPRAEGAMGLTALANVTAQQIVWIEEGVTRARADLTYHISRADLAALTVEVPAAYKVVNVADANVRQWSVSEGAGPGVQHVDVQLFEPAQGTQRIRVELERFTSGDDTNPFEVPRIRAIDVARQQGVLVVASAADLRADVVRATGLVQMDAGELPPALRRDTWDFAYRYSTMPVALALAVEKIEPYVTVDALVRIRIEPERLRLGTLALYDIQRAGVFRLELDLPEGYDVRTVRGRAIGDAAAVEVDTHHLTGEDKRRLVVSLARRALGRVGLEVELVQNLGHPELLAPTGTAVEIDVAVPRVAPGTADRETGRLVIFAPDSLRVDPVHTNGLRSVAGDEALAGMEAVAAAKAPTLAFVYASDPVNATIALERRRPYVTVRQLLTAYIEPGVVRYDATFFYDILYSGVRSLRIDVPTELSPIIRHTTPDVRDRPMDPQPDDVAEGMTAWSFTGEREFIGSIPIRLLWERKLEKLDVGKSVDVTMPRLVPQAADRAWGQVVLTKAETIDVQPTGDPKGVRPIDPQHDLMPGASVPGAARTFEFHDAWALNVTATHYALEEVKRTSIERSLVRTVVTRGDEVSVQALYRMRSARQRLMVGFPAGVAFDTQPVRINGQAASLERGDKDEYFVSLVGQDPDAPFLLELRYTLGEAGAGALGFPTFPDEPAVQKVYLYVHVPEERAWLGTRGRWSDEMLWRLDTTSPLANWTPRPRLSEAALIAWVTQGIEQRADVAGGLQTDGRVYLFSTLRPAAPPAGALRLSTLDERLLAAMVFGLIVLGGFGLLRASAPRRWLTAGIFGVTLVLIGVFLPTFALQVMDGVMLAAIVVVLVMWTVWYLARTRPRDPVVLARKEAKRNAAIAAAAAPPIATAGSPLSTPPSPPPLPPDASGKEGQP